MAPQPEAGEPAGGRPKTHLEGYRWYLMLALGLLQLVLARYVPIPWLPADKVVLSGYVEECSIGGVLVLFFALSAVPLEQKGFTWVRFVSAFFQGLIAGHLLIFDLSTLYARASWALCLGVANALDRLASIRHIVRRSQQSPTEVQVTVGAKGRIKYDGQDHEVTVKSVVGDQLTIAYNKRPFYWSNTETVPMGSDRLTITQGVTLNNQLIQDHMHGGYRLRPLGYTLGICMSQWLLYGFSTADSFVSGMLTGQAMIIFFPPVLAIILYVIGQRNPDNECMQFLVFVVFCASCALVLIAFLPASVAFAAFAAAELWTHQIIAFIAIISDNVFFLAAVRPTREDLAKYGFAVMVLNADSYVATVRASRAGRGDPLLADSGLRRALLS